MNEELKIIEKEYKHFYEKFEYINENTFCIHIKIDEIEDNFSNLKENNLNLYIKFHCDFFEVLNQNLIGEKKFDCIEQVFNTYCPISFKKFIMQKIKCKLNSNL
ncbi:conserved Plasmodium protein, unknown function [Plasmodium relictum]|uniref:Uncharacterized protein n=1 Tax=Plasmodium relictum TaxID=85471 RepID=A0A1J1H770_PLARL|nr:conserved Plasmodium protein, unknown function [Plasmodium relictum]CRG99278.1 conserved Plasmodium protein, unknown function [Plasmodium relictum]